MQVRRKFAESIVYTFFILMILRALKRWRLLPCHEFRARWLQNYDDFPWNVKSQRKNDPGADKNAWCFQHAQVLTHAFMHVGLYTCACVTLLHQCSDVSIHRNDTFDEHITYDQPVHEEACRSTI